jgi:hypothetical protein
MKMTKCINLVITLIAIGFLSIGTATTVKARSQAGQEVELGDTKVITALIVGIDRRDRTLTLVGPEGNVNHFEVGDEARNFDQIKVGDHVKIEYHMSIALHIGEPGTQPQADAGLVVARAPEGAKPAGFAVGAVSAGGFFRLDPFNI